MVKFLRKLLGNERGNFLLIAAAAFPLLIGFAGLAVDTIQWVLWKRELQRAADSAAIAGVYQRVLTNTQTGVESAVCTDLLKNQHTGMPITGSGAVTCTNGTTRGPVVLLADDTVNKVLFPVQVTLTVSRSLTFSSYFGSTPPITATATAGSVPGHDQYCLIALESNPANTGIIGTGNSAVEMDCGMITNDPAANSAAANGSSSMTATVIASVGGIQSSNNWHVGKYDPYVTAIADPYAAVNVDPLAMKCAVGPGHGNQTGPIALDDTTDLNNVKDALGNPANCFTSLSVGSGRTLNLPAGTYYINAGSVNVQGTLTGTDVTIVLTNTDPSLTAPIGTFKMNAQALMTLTAPTSGTYKDIAIYQDRRATDINNPNQINGGSGSTVTGALYFPKQQLTYNGNGTLNAICTRFVTRRIIFSGNNSTSNKFAKDCGTGNNPPYEGGRLVRLTV
jgi:Flp pilus assembly protein TadG